MIFIKNKKAWKEFLRGCVSDVVVGDGPPKEYPCFLGMTGAFWASEERVWEIVYRDELESMIKKIDSGREF